MSGIQNKKRLFNKLVIARNKIKEVEEIEFFFYKNFKDNSGFLTRNIDVSYNSWIVKPGSDFDFIITQSQREL